MGVEPLCRELPQEFATFLSYVRNLKFDEEPDYAFLRRVFAELFKKSNFVHDFCYDWNLREIDTDSYKKVKVTKPKKEGEKIIAVTPNDISGFADMAIEDDSESKAYGSSKSSAADAGDFQYWWMQLVRFENYMYLICERY